MGESCYCRLAARDAQAAAQLQELPSNGSFQACLRTILPRSVREGNVRLEAAAAAMHCSALTLQRRFQDRGLSFNAVLDEVHQPMAERYLRRPKPDLIDIALLCGYSELSAFNRAF